MNVVEWVFGKRITPQERLRKNQRAIDKTIRELEREKKKLEKEEGTTRKEVEAELKAGRNGPAKIKARALHRRRKYIERFDKSSTQLKAISLRIQTVRTNEQMAVSLKSASKVLAGMNRSMNIPQLSKIAQDFERENDIMEQRQDIMEDAVDDALGDEEEEEASDEVIDQILAEITLGMKSSLGVTPEGFQSAAVPETKVAEAIGGGGGDDDLQARLDSLRR